MRLFSRLNNVLECMSNAGIGYTLEQCSKGNYPYRNIVMMNYKLPIFLPTCAWVYENDGLE